MCWVMPPRSPAATLVLRTASSRLVLPWSTCPMIVTIGARVTSLAGSSSVKRGARVASPPLPPGATSAASSSPSFVSVAPRSVVSKPSSPATREAVSKSIVWLTVAKIPFRISSLITSEGVRPSACARSVTATDEGSSTGPVGRTGAVSVMVAELCGPRLRGGRGPRRGWYLRGGILSLERHGPRLRCRTEGPCHCLRQA